MKKNETKKILVIGLLFLVMSVETIQIASAIQINDLNNINPHAKSITSNSKETTWICGFIFNASDFGDAIIIHSLLCLFYKTTVIDNQIIKSVSIWGPRTIGFIPYHTKEGIIANHFINAKFFYQ